MASKERYQLPEEPPLPWYAGGWGDLVHLAVWIGGLAAAVWILKAVF